MVAANKAQHAVDCITQKHFETVEAEAVESEEEADQSEKVTTGVHSF